MADFELFSMDIDCFRYPLEYSLNSRDSYKRSRTFARDANLITGPRALQPVNWISRILEVPAKLSRMI